MALAGARVASAHAARIATDPAENAALAQGPQRVSATFNEELQPEFAAMTVVGPDGNLWSSGDPQVQGAVIAVGVRPLGPAGHLHGELPGDVGGRPPGVGFVVVPAHGGRDRHAGPGGRQTRRLRRRRRIPVWPFLVAGALIIGGGILWAARRRT